MTIAQQLKIKEFPFVINDNRGNEIYFERSNGEWIKHEYDSNGNQIYYEDSDGYWDKREYNSMDKKVYLELSDGYWSKNEYDSNGNQIYYENSNGYIEDNRPKAITELTMDAIAKKFNVPVETLKIKK